MRVRVLVAVCAMLVAMGATACAPAPPMTPGNGIAQDLFDRVNAERAARGLAPLSYDHGLEQLATDWAAHMASAGLSHNPKLPGDVGENVATGQTNSGQVHASWMGSDGHRRNLLSEGYGSVGIGIVCSGGQIFAVADFRLAPGATGVGGTPAAQPVARPEASGVGC